MEIEFVLVKGGDDIANTLYGWYHRRKDSRLRIYTTGGLGRQTTILTVVCDVTQIQEVYNYFRPQVETLFD